MVTTPADLARDKAAALKLTPVSRETETRLDAYVALLLQWQRRMNLVAPSTLPTIWTRHVADSLQLLPLAPHARRWLDFGSGAGFPGMVIACALADEPGASVHLVESNTRKAAFLREAARVSGAPAIVHAERFEAVAENLPAVEIVTARAVAPLADLIGYAAAPMRKGAEALFLKGQDVDAELTESAKYWTFDHTIGPSVTDPRGRIVRITHAQRIEQSGKS
ncbi:MAG: 16S rRNA (guanine(527)-N(7))-methyltransferase RsmG [Rhizobiales bacterium]|nr:16S rRNA (guanine(527)-N(7))-methyltransferase RsmG [Hyphomicrobiales bacterium]